MKKARLFLIFTVILTLSVLVFVGCQKTDNITAVSLKGYDPKKVIETTVGNFDCSAYTLVVTRESGATEEVALTEEMIAEADLFKFYQEGEHDINVTYNKKQCAFKISVKRNTFGELTLPQNNVFTYDGNTHTVEVQGDLPANATVTYIGGNSFVNAGAYDVTAVVTCDGYVTERLSTKVEIKKAVYDMSGVVFESKEFVYDGIAHSVSIEGTLPEGIAEPTYIINEMKTSSAIDVGEYEVIARFANTNSNYESIPEMKATLTINPAQCSFDNVDLVFTNDNGTAIEGKLKVYDGASVMFDIDDYDKLLGKATPMFTIYDQDGVAISGSNQSTNILDAGIYTVTVDFVLIDNKNYLPVEPISFEFEIKKAIYDMTYIHFDNDVVACDGSEHSLTVTIPSDHPIGQDAVAYEYYFDGELLVDDEGNPVQSVSAAGEYRVKAIFTVTDENFEQIGDLEAVLRIEQVL